MQSKFKNIIAIGCAAANIARKIKKYNKEYCTYIISNQNKKNTKFNFRTVEFKHPEEAEEFDTKRIDKFLASVNSETRIIVCGASFTSGLTLKILRPLYERGVSLNVVYIMPEIEILSETSSLQERVVRGVLQEYARSGAFTEFKIISNSMISSLAQPSSVMERYEKINDAIASTIYMMDNIRSAEPVSSTVGPLKETSRVGSISVASLDPYEERPFFPLDNVSELVYHFGIHRNKLETEIDLFEKITTIVKEKKELGYRVSFAIYPTRYEEDYIYVEGYSSEIQKID